jgi:hypothetical protein
LACLSTNLSSSATYCRSCSSCVRCLPLFVGGLGACGREALVTRVLGSTLGEVRSRLFGDLCPDIMARRPGSIVIFYGYYGGRRVLLSSPSLHLEFGPNGISREDSLLSSRAPHTSLTGYPISALNTRKQQLYIPPPVTLSRQVWSNILSSI